MGINKFLSLLSCLGFPPSYLKAPSKLMPKSKIFDMLHSTL